MPEERSWNPNLPGATAQADEQYAPVVPPTVSGSRGGNAALTSLLTVLASQGYIINNTSA